MVYAFDADEKARQLRQDLLIGSKKIWDRGAMLTDEENFGSLGRTTLSGLQAGIQEKQMSLRGSKTHPLG
jgi:hypothetical protein